VGSVGVVVVDPAGDDDAGLGELVELLAVEELAAGASVGRFDEAVLPGRARIDGVSLDAVGCPAGQTVERRARHPQRAADRRGRMPGLVHAGEGRPPSDRRAHHFLRSPP